MFVQSFYAELIKVASSEAVNPTVLLAKQIIRMQNSNHTMRFAGGGAAPGSAGYGLEKKAKPFLEQDRPDKVKEIYSALKRDHPDMPASMKARIAIRKSRKSPQARKSPKHGGPPYKAPVNDN